MLTAQPTLPIDAIVVHPHNIRRDLGDLSDVTETIPAVGILEPLVVAPINGTVKGCCPRCRVRMDLSEKGYVPAHQLVGRLRCPGSSRHPEEVRSDYVLIAGHRRLAAAKLCGQKEVPVTIRADLDTEPKQIAAMAIENIGRKNLTVVEEAAAYQMLLDFGEDYTPQRIASTVGVSPRTVKMRLGLNRLPAHILDRTHDGQISLAEAEALASFARDPDALAELEPLLGTGNFRLRVQMIRDRADYQRKATQLRRQLEAEGMRVIDTPDGYPWHSTETRVIDLPDLDGKTNSHSTCPGHAVVVVSNSSGTRYEAVCVDPETHGHLAKTADYTSGQPTDDPESPPPSQLTPPRTAELTAAETLRDKFAADTIHGRLFLRTRLLELLRGVAAVLLDELDEYEDIAPLAKLLNIADPGSNEEIRAWVDGKIAAAKDVDSIAAVLLAVMHVGYTPSNQTRWTARDAKWVLTLAAMGYEPADIERELLGHAIERPVETVTIAGDAL